MFYGLNIDDSSRCLHYHSERDVVSLKCAHCQRYYACFQCHDHLEEHRFLATSPQEPYPVLCGVCRQYLSLADYKKGSCCYCQALFNPNCRYHEAIYFSKETEFNVNY